MKMLMSAETLSEQVFLRDDKIGIRLGDRAGSKDIFFVCFELFCKGFAMLYSNDTNVVQVNRLTIDQFDHVARKLRNAGIRVVDIRHDLKFAVPEDYAKCTLSESIQAVKDAPDNLLVDAYGFRCMVNGVIHNVHFELI